MPADSANAPPPDPAFRTFTAVLLAGGRSTRMGRDKASLPCAGATLWEHQLATLRATGAGEVCISGPRHGPYANCGVPVLEDRTQNAGPLAALETALPRAPYLLVLAIDMPAMRADFLRELMRTALRTRRSVIPEIEGRFEPLAAVYASALAPLVDQALRGPDHSMQQLVREALGGELAVQHSVPAEARALFRNLNTPADWDDQRL
jgi:molybdopterin-guanine dinucleotide biosynthesis protein A